MAQSIPSYLSHSRYDTLKQSTPYLPGTCAALGRIDALFLTGINPILASIYQDTLEDTHVRKIITGLWDFPETLYEMPDCRKYITA